ncbi:Cytochrome b [Caenorhabditis elegans]|uniref:Cytochrome b n=1 Tax=Caenorhabditis elegans TaxID=6239 RepID=Q9TZF9_CAEEL|nr:Cytochrome b [Caenorhabditis elegans]CCD71277.1 Cytochrome b [Caenorhabditis elegans]|eukprot:NP_494046.2 Uncharacterized protein CELE_F58E1.13 [Caenorhabditis elegans]
MQIIANSNKIVLVINYITHNNELIYTPQGLKFSKFVANNQNKVDIYIKETVSEKPEFDITHPTPCWSFRVYNSSYSGFYWLETMSELQNVINCHN